MKMANASPEVKDRVEKIFEQHKAFVNSEIQQRANEYAHMINYDNEDFVVSCVV
jgi:hypothetical protein